MNIPGVGGLISKLLPSVERIVDDLHTSGEERAQAKQKIQELLVSAEQEAQKEESEKEEEHGHNESEKSEIHSEFKSNYYWNCQHLDEIDSIGTQLMTFFPQIEEIRVNWISNNGQGSLELESKDDRIKGWK